ncbi:AMP-binding protein [Massilia glaciei]|uniref:Long-chain-fatty-acid--CoA ligase n=1 Tax=Massilia glaciei TaxID=1524097 RepID=A0A2U2HK97_9BURK|nr:AMP-binding protein [Massilia glaciei]PWF47903.1 long-chain-fatty-acid--CoA ligase [Massilia glaciei]
MNDKMVQDNAPWVARYSKEIDWQLNGPTDASLPAMLATAARTYAKHKAFTCVMPNGMYGTLSYEQVDSMSDGFAVYLRETLGLQAGARVALQSPNSLVTPVAAFGILKAGCVLVNVNPLYTAKEMKHQFNDAGVEALVIVDMFADKLAEILGQTGVKHVLMSSVPSFFPPLVRHIIKGIMRWWNRVIPSTSVKATRFEAAVAIGQRVRDAKKIDVGQYWKNLGHADLAVLQYTGGTTGVAKGAMLSHGNLLWNMEQIMAVGRANIDNGKEVVLTALPLYHIYAFTANLLMFYKTGGRNILVPSPRPIQNLQRAVENYKITWISGVNTLYNALMNEEWFNAFPPKHLKASIGGGAAMHHSVVKRWEKMTGRRLLEAYGLTETAPLVCSQLHGGPSKTDSIGVPAPHTDIRLVDDDGVDVAPGQPGELIVRGPQVMQGYWNQADETANVLRNGWFHTGDVAVMDEDCTFRIVDRKKDMILVSGFNVYPNEIEEVLSAHDKVMEAAIVGVPDVRTGEAVRAYVVKRDDTLTEEELAAHCRQNLAAYKVPVRFTFRDELPKTPIGKILRKDLRTEALAEHHKSAA